ncbi:uncharacterized protein DC041_0005090 [Schistosoma bovis]|uniref:P-type ATPase C-terminal domain-containing protein n=1 Tax=Schistosoma bovis TaxID=6184 RepID=A0A430QDY8_SCHBO|nr:uncharacterized protein DC041_0005090 [Schistosoma bovis]
MLFFYHKSVAFVTNQLCLIYFNGYSDIPLFGTILFVCYNLTMTFLISHQANLRAWYIVLWILDGIWHGVVTFFIPFFCLAGGNLYAEAIFYETKNNSYRIYDFTMIGNASFVYLWIAVTLRSTIWTRDFNMMLIMSHIGTTLNVVILFLFQTFVPSTSNEYQRYAQLCRSPAFWFAFPLTVFIANIPGLIWRLASDTWWTIRIELKNLPKKNKRKSYLNNPLVWLKAFVFGQTEENESILQKNENDINTFKEQINHSYQP